MNSALIFSRQFKTGARAPFRADSNCAPKSNLAAKVTYGLAAIFIFGDSISFAIEIGQPVAVVPSSVGNKLNSVGSFLGMPHLKQPDPNSDCCTTACSMAFQVYSGLRLKSTDVSMIANVVSRSADVGLTGARPSKILPLLGMPAANEKSYNPKRLKDLSAVKLLALEALHNEILLSLNEGNYVMLGLRIPSVSAGAHMVAMTGYNSSSRTFSVHDPLNDSATEWSIDQILDRWPNMRDPAKGYRLGAFFINRPLLFREISEPEISKQIKVDPKFRSLVAVHPDMIVSNLNTLTPEVTWNDVAKHWEKGRNPQEATGLALLVKLQIAQGKPVFLSSCLAVGKRGMNIIVAHGYKGEYDDVNGSITVSGDFERTGTVATRDITTRELIDFCAIPAPARTYLSLGFVSPPSSTQTGTDPSPGK